MKNTTVYDYATPVHKVLMEPNVILGIGVVPVMFILVLTIFLMNLVSIWTGFVGVGLYIAAKRICKNDPFMLEILFERLMLPNDWRA